MTKVLSARVPDNKFLRVDLLAQLRNVDRAAIVENGIDLVLCAAPEAATIDAMMTAGHDNDEMVDDSSR